MARSGVRSAALVSIFGIALVLAGSSPASTGTLQTFSKAFDPATIGPGSGSTLRFDIVNLSTAPETELAFTDVLPAGVVLATPSNPVNGCGGVLSAPDGGDTITLSDGVVSGSSTCTVAVNVTSSTPGLHTNVSGDLTTSSGSSGNAIADLNVVTDRPGFSKSFAPASIGFGARSTLTFTIDNTLNASIASSLTFTDDLPPGMSVADPALAATTCGGGAVTADPGTTLVSYGPQFPGDATVAPGVACAVSVDVVGAAVGTLANVSGVLTTANGLQTVSSGFATDALEVTSGLVFATKEFTDDPVSPGATVTIEFTVSNNDRNFPATSIAFTDDLDATLAGLAAIGLPAADICGAGSTLSGTSVLTLTGGSLPPEGSCTFQATLQVPAAAATGVWPNATSAISAVVDGSPVTTGPASDSLVVSTAPLLTKSFLNDPVGAGQIATVEFTITNTSSTSPATDLAFDDNLSAFLSGTTIAVLPPAGFCGAGSTITSFQIAGQDHLVMAGGSLGAGASCVFQVDLQLPVGGPSGAFVNTTSQITGVVDGLPQLGSPATDTLTVVTAPRLSKSFTDDPVAPGGTATREFTIVHDPTAPTDATSISFSDDLGAVLTGLSAVGLPAADVCGAGSQLSGTTTLAFSGGNLAPGSTCSFGVTLQVPAAALPGAFLNITSDLVAVVAGATPTSPPAQDVLQISGLNFSKSFTDDPVIPGDTVTLEFSIDNTSATSVATDMTFSDDLGATLSGLVATGLPMTDICGAGSQLTGTNFLTFTGGNLAAGATCTFAVTLQVPAGAASNTYGNTTSNLAATINGANAILLPASDQLVVDDNLLDLTKEFTDDPVAPGDTATLEFTLANLDPVRSATGITFTDDLDAALSGMTAVTLPPDGFCGAGSQISGAALLTVTGANLAGGAACTFGVTVQVPPTVLLGTTAVNTTSFVSGLITALPVSGSPATDTLRIDAMDFSKAFDGPTGAGSTAVLSFTIDNLDAANGIAGLSFSDDLDAVVPGLAAVGLPLSDICGAGSLIAGTSFLTLTNGGLPPSGTCTVNVTVAVPAAAAPGTYANITSDLLAAGIPVGSPASANLIVEPPPAFSKTFTPALVLIGGTSSLQLAIDNTAATIAADNLDLTDTLPTGMVVATPPNASTTCTGGTLTAVAGSGSVSYAGGSVAAGAACTISVDVTALAAGNLVNTTGDLTSSLGNSGAATDTLGVAEGSFSLSKTFVTAPVLRGGSVVLEFTLTNTSATSPLTAIGFTDDLGAVVPGLAAAGLPATDICGAGSQLTGTSVLSFSGGSLAPQTSCTFSAAVVVPAGAPLGTFANTTSTVSAVANGLGVTAPAAVDDIEIAYLAFAKTFLGSALPGGTVDLEFAVSNPDPANGAAAISFTDDLDAVVPGMVAVGLPTPDVCGAGSQIAGASLLTLNGGNLAPGAPCVFTVTLQVPGGASGGSYLNTTSVLSAAVSGTPVSGDPGSEASDVLQIDDLEAPVFTKAFAPATISVGGVSTLTFSIDNTASGSDATGLDFTDTLPAGMVVANPANAGTTCTGGTLNATAGAGVIAYTGGTVAAGASCTVSADVEALSPGSLVNVSGDLTSSAGSSGSATGTLTVIDGATAIPVLDRRGLLLLAALMAAIGVLAVRCKR
jgi:uncharacterized repeat protein (TIGR01451 family)